MLCLSLQRHHFAQAIAILNTQGCNIFEKFSRKVRYKISHYIPIILFLSLTLFEFLSAKLFLMFSRTTNECWIWWETSFWLQTWLTTFAFSRTCRRWQMVSPSSSACTASRLIFLLTVLNSKGKLRCPPQWHQRCAHKRKNCNTNYTSDHFWCFTSTQSPLSVL